MAEAERSFVAVPKPEHNNSAPAADSSKRSWFDLPDGTAGIAVLLLLSSLCGALIAIYWPFGQGGGESGTGDRLSTLELRVDEIAAGRSSKVAGEVFADQRREISALGTRIDADEARLATMEKSENAEDAGDVGSLKARTDKNTEDVKQVSDRLMKLETGARLINFQASNLLRNEIQDRADALRDRLSRSEERIDALEKSAPPADLAQRLDSFALKSEEGALETRVLQLETRDMSSVMRRAAAVMALADLVRASAGGDPFLDQLIALKSLAPASPEIQDLARYATKGVPTRTTLAESFSRQADAILGTERASKAWSDQVWSSVMNIVSTRRTPNATGNDSEARVARAEVDLNLGELARAVREVSALSGAAREMADPWLKSANERMNVDRDARTLAQRLVANLSTQPTAVQAQQVAAPVK